jgi:chorismate mutase
MGRHRTLISDLDFQLIELLSQRMKISEKIGNLKRK